MLFRSSKLIKLKNIVMKTYFNQNLKLIRKAYGFSQAKLAKKLILFGKEDKEKKTAKSIEAVNALKKNVGNDLNHLVFNENTRGKKHTAYVVGVLFEDGWFHVVHPGEEMGIQMANRMKKALEDSLRNKLGVETPDD